MKNPNPQQLLLNWDSLGRSEKQRAIRAIEPAEQRYPVEVSATLRAYQQEVAREVAPAEREPAPGAL